MAEQVDLVSIIASLIGGGVNAYQNRDEYALNKSKVALDRAKTASEMRKLEEENRPVDADFLRKQARQAIGFDYTQPAQPQSPYLQQINSASLNPTSPSFQKIPNMDGSIEPAINPYNIPQVDIPPVQTSPAISTGNRYSQLSKQHNDDINAVLANKGLSRSLITQKINEINNFYKGEIEKLPWQEIPAAKQHMDNIMNHPDQDKAYLLESTKNMTQAELNEYLAEYGKYFLDPKRDALQKAYEGKPQDVVVIDEFGVKQTLPATVGTAKKVEEDYYKNRDIRIKKAQTLEEEDRAGLNKPWQENNETKSVVTGLMEIAPDFFKDEAKKILAKFIDPNGVTAKAFKQIQPAMVAAFNSAMQRAIDKQTSTDWVDDKGNIVGKIMPVFDGTKFVTKQIKTAEVDTVKKQSQLDYEKAIATFNNVLTAKPKIEVPSPTISEVVGGKTVAETVKKETGTKTVAETVKKETPAVTAPTVTTNTPAVTPAVATPAKVPNYDPLAPDALGNGGDYIEGSADPLSPVATPINDTPSVSTPTKTVATSTVPSPIAEKVKPTRQLSANPDFGKRYNSNEYKGNGFLGNIGTKDKPITEYSVGIKIDGKEAQIPTLVPGLTATEINYIKAQKIDKNSPVWKSIVNKAVEFAQDRIDNGLSVWAYKDEIGNNGKPVVNKISPIVKTENPSPVAKKEVTEQVEKPIEEDVKSLYEQANENSRNPKEGIKKLFENIPISMVKDADDFLNTIETEKYASVDQSIIKFIELTNSRDMLKNLAEVIYIGKKDSKNKSEYKVYPVIDRDLGQTTFTPVDISTEKGFTAWNEGMKEWRKDRKIPVNVNGKIKWVNTTDKQIEDNLAELKRKGLELENRGKEVGIGKTIADTDKAKTETKYIPAEVGAKVTTARAAMINANVNQGELSLKNQVFEWEKTKGKPAYSPQDLKDSTTANIALKKIRENLISAGAISQSNIDYDSKGSPVNPNVLKATRVAMAHRALLQGFSADLLKSTDISKDDSQEWDNAISMAKELIIEKFDGNTKAASKEEYLRSLYNKIYQKLN